MGRPTIGRVIEPSTPADISEASLEDACGALQEVGVVPRMLTLGNGHTYSVSEIRDLARKFGMEIEDSFDSDPDEWAVHDLEPGENRTTYWVRYL